MREFTERQVRGEPDRRRSELQGEAARVQQGRLLRLERLLHLQNFHPGIPRRALRRQDQQERRGGGHQLVPARHARQDRVRGVPGRQPDREPAAGEDPKLHVCQVKICLKTIISSRVKIKLCVLMIRFLACSCCC